MISDSERREVAARLRSKEPKEFAFPFGKPVFMHIFNSVFQNQMLLTNWILRLPYQLADIIDRPTCHMEPEGEGFRCSFCGKLHDFSGFEEFPWPYCPNCGSEVIRDDD